MEWNKCMFFERPNLLQRFSKLCPPWDTRAVSRSTGLQSTSVGHSMFFSTNSNGVRSNEDLVMLCVTEKRMAEEANPLYSSVITPKSDALGFPGHTLRPLSLTFETPLLADSWYNVRTEGGAPTYSCSCNIAVAPKDGAVAEYSGEYGQGCEVKNIPGFVNSSLPRWLTFWGRIFSNY